MIAALSSQQQELANARALYLDQITQIWTSFPTSSQFAAATRDTEGLKRIRALEKPDWKRERDAFRDAGFGRFETSKLLAIWWSHGTWVESARRVYAEQLDMRKVTARSLAWLLAGSPGGDAVASINAIVARLEELQVRFDIYVEQPENPYQRRLLDAWNALA